MLKKKANGIVAKIPTPRDDEYPPEIQSRIAALKLLYAQHAGKLEEVKVKKREEKRMRVGDVRGVRQFRTSEVHG